MKPEEKARKDSDSLLLSAGLAVQNRDEINLGASLGVDVREYHNDTVCFIRCPQGFRGEAKL